MNKLGCLIVLFVASTVYFNSGCNPSKNVFDFREIEKGNLLNKATEIKLHQFIPLWVENEIHPKHDINLHELYRDPDFTYFGNHYTRLEVFYKIKNDDLFQVDYKSIVGDSIRNKMYYEIVPQSDRKKAEVDCLMGFRNGNFKYRYLETGNAIEVTFHWKVKCDFFVKLDKNTLQNIVLKTYQLVNCANCTVTEYE